MNAFSTSKVPVTSGEEAGDSPVSVNEELSDKPQRDVQYEEKTEKASWLEYADATDRLRRLANHSHSIVLNHHNALIYRGKSFR